ncbi:CTP synthase [Patescibacteria group bacterium]
MKKKSKFIFVVGGVMSGVGKGVSTASIGKLLQSCGLNVTAIKVDPYVNVDAGTMNPTEHGEVFVLNDGYECDQDMGNYERFLGVTLPSDNYMTTGRVYESVIGKERNLEYKGKCVQVVPHIPLEIIRRIEKASKKADADVTIIEIGGTVGEYENILFLEASRMMKMNSPQDVITVMVSYIPTPKKVGEMKTKPTQHAVRTLNSAGVQPDIIIARSDVALDEKRKEKIAMHCNIPSENVISAPDIESIYDVPINFEKDNVSKIILNKLDVKGKIDSKEGLKDWEKLTKKIKKAKDEVNIAIVGKYFDTGDFVLSDSYISVIEAVKFSAYKLNKKPKIHWINSKDFSGKNADLKSLKKYDGILVPGGFGESGIEGKLKVIQYARENKIPYFGICYGMQLAVIEYVRNVLGIKNANTVEIDEKTKDQVIGIIENQKEKMKNKEYGGSMRLGAYPAILKKGSIAQKAYGLNEIKERHRHRFEVNPDYIDQITEGGMIFSGVSPDEKLMEIVELPKEKHPFFLAVQFHPEFKASPLNPHPLFTEFIKASLKKKTKV